ncbi:MAG: NAD(P)-dependent oxidoreductase [Lachnospiraceae bacterium]|nr:NAD(P)-dependent oxidoreductase [Lachnospiraceae bacterium]
MQKVGFIGLGIMGAPMVRCLLKSGYLVNIYDRSGLRSEELSKEGAVLQKNPRQVAVFSDVIITMLPNSGIVEEVMFGENGLYEGMSAGKIFIDMGSSDYKSNQQICEWLKEKGAKMLDAPVTGSFKGAQEGTLTIMVGGDSQTFEQVRPILETMGEKIVPVGPVGTADIAKACNQMLFALNIAAVSEVMALAVKAGLDPEVLLSIVNAGSGESYAGRVKMANFVFKRNFKPGFTLQLMAKDVDIALNMGRSLQVPLRLGNLVRENIRIAQNKGYELDDCSCVIRIAEEDSGVVVEPFSHKNREK